MDERQTTDETGIEVAKDEITGKIEQARTLARSVGEQAWSTASTATTAARDLAQQAREQTSNAIEPLYEQGVRASEYLTRNVNEYPLAALLVAGAIGYGVGYLMHTQWGAPQRPQRAKRAPAGERAGKPSERRQSRERRD